MFLRLAAVGLTLLALRLSVSAWGSSAALSLPSAGDPRAAGLPAAVLLPDDTRAQEQAIRFFEDRLRSDPEDARAYASLAGYHLQRLRDTNNTQYLTRALGAAQSSLAVVPDVRNIAGLTVLAQAELSAHEFIAARDRAQRLIELDPSKGASYGILGDALLELGDYEPATEAFRQMAARGRSTGTEARLARYASLRGETEVARRHLFSALALTLNLPSPPREPVAWSRWQLGELAFGAGDYATAERHYRDALTTFPGYLQAVASLGRVRAAQGDLPGAIKQYEDAIQRFPDPAYVAALGDLYTLTGRHRDAANQYELVEQIGRLTAATTATAATTEASGSSGLNDRQLALFYADHDLKPEEAYALAAREYEVRRDIYGADALAWTALKAGKLAEAQAAIEQALRLGTKDARLFYHAGMIARAAGDQPAARTHLERALALNPQFDPLQAAIARRALAP